MQPAGGIEWARWAASDDTNVLHQMVPRTWVASDGSEHGLRQPWRARWKSECPPGSVCRPRLRARAQRQPRRVEVHRPALRRQLERLLHLLALLPPEVLHLLFGTIELKIWNDLSGLAWP
jgi:hypothetical protein